MSVFLMCLLFGIRSNTFICPFEYLYFVVGPGRPQPFRGGRERGMMVMVGKGRIDRVQHGGLGTGKGGEGKKGNIRESKGKREKERGN